MGKLFGTDGIRGVVNETLDANLAYKIGCAAAIVLAENNMGKPVFVVGKDTRISGDMLEAALTAGLCAYGADVMLLGVMPTPAIAYLAKRYGAAAGVVISASHNPYEHNGIKLFSGDGYKLSDETEEKIENYILADELPKAKTHGEIGRVVRSETAFTDYIDFLASTTENLSGIRVLVDCANGAAYATAPQLFKQVGACAKFISCEPSGININVNCGSTHIGNLSEMVRNGDYDLGIAFDGDADRCLAVDENGTPIDGDQIMTICADALKKGGRLPGDGFVATVMSNLGLHKYCKEKELNLLCASVGDRYVLEMMKEKGMSLGGEQSGHVIFHDIMTTGDGELTALQLMRFYKTSGKKLSELAGAITKYPQTLLNVPGPASNAEKKKLIELEVVQNALRAEEDMLKGNGRILLRPSGTEPLIRVMVEAATQETAEEVAKRIAAVVESVKN